MPKAVAQTRSNPRMSGAGVAGDEHNHSSTVLPTEHAVMADHAQQDDELADVQFEQDPNLSGHTQTEDTVSWLAGPLNGWTENDDYREFLETGERPSSRLLCCYDERDGDYDDNGGMPTAIGHSRGRFRTNDGGYTEPNDSGHADQIGPVIVRRL